MNLYVQQTERRQKSRQITFKGGLFLFEMGSYVAQDGLKLFF